MDLGLVVLGTVLFIVFLIWYFNFRAAEKTKRPYSPPTPQPPLQSLPPRDQELSFEIILPYREQRPPENPTPKSGRQPPQTFDIIMREVNPDAWCLMTGLKVAECTCTEHKGIK